LHRYQIVVACCVSLFLASCFQTTAVESHVQPLDAHQARIYIIRQPSVLSSLGAPDIKVDGRLVGTLAVGSYLVVDRPPGSHRITVYGALDSVGFETEMAVGPGVSYYLELGPIVKTNIDGFRLDSMGITGQPVAGHGGPNSPYMFYSLDAASGAASVAKLPQRNS
jgi:Protein of unknown function (DUF2846)